MDESCRTCRCVKSHMYMCVGRACMRYYTGLFVEWHGGIVQILLATHTFVILQFICIHEHVYIHTYIYICVYV